jgi:ABC-type oligopeptide transport system substrate-binding subunit
MLILYIDRRMNMKHKKIMILIMISVSIVVLIGAINNKELKPNSNKSKSYGSGDNIKELNPISKSSVINILKAQYGELISISESEVKKTGDEYVVEVFIGNEDEEEHEEEHEHEEHNTSLGIHKINVFTGELTFPN